MTEHDLAEIARKNYSREGYRLALMQWADFAEENGLGYEMGLREMAMLSEPKRPRLFSQYPRHYGWFFYPFPWHSGNRCELSELLLPLMQNEAIFETRSNCVVLKYLDFLDAIREAARAYVKAKEPAGANRQEGVLTP